MREERGGSEDPPRTLELLDHEQLRASIYRRIVNACSGVRRQRTRAGSHKVNDIAGNRTGGRGTGCHRSSAVSGIDIRWREAPTGLCIFGNVLDAMRLEFVFRPGGLSSVA